ncbi:putative methyltransferase-domain-containing protein [Phyllosticta citribraziliensis]
MANNNRETAGEMLHVLDLPQLYTRPSAQELLNTLTLLTSEPPSWECSDSEDEELSLGLETRRRRKTSAVKATPPQINPEGLAAYLTRIIASDLRWIQDEDTKVEIWEAASIRLSERSGRTGMGAISRKFWIPLTKEGAGEDIQIYEPPLTGDNLGLKTWASSYLLAKKLHRLADNRRLFPFSGKPDPPTILELGSGTGLVGLAAAAAIGAEVILTDLPEIIENVDRNIDSNRDILEEHNGNAFSAILDWTTPSTMMLSPSAVKHAHHKGDSKFDVILAADPLYSPEHPVLLVQTIAFWLSRVESARAVIELPLRSAYRPQVEDFFSRMQAIGLRIYAEGYETGYDDWGGPDGRKAVRCWWTVWGHESLDASEAHAVEHDEHVEPAQDMAQSHHQLIREFLQLESEE